MLHPVSPEGVVQRDRLLLAGDVADQRAPVLVGRLDPGDPFVVRAKASSNAMTVNRARDVPVRRRGAPIDFVHDRDRSLIQSSISPD
ncbi:hypothetical protein [Reyranella soli]|jgi:hypothetical protein|uniref:hypothetical protein n=1 Tax=Reyranella soli TaxID=1230389 RepID=UPI0011BF108B|nr:hypothetical protein [Reyranella soli]